MTTTYPWQVGQTIAGLYQIRGINTEGGMGVVYFVWHTGWNMELVIKSPRPELLADQSARDRFTHEAETWVDLGLHPNIVSAYYVRQIDHFPRIILEKMDGGSLKTWLARGKLKDLATVLDIAIQVATGLGYAQKRQPNFLHRDIKPANVLMTPHGQAKLTDFGLVGATEGMVGTPAYMAPEVWTDLEHITPAADLYSFGVLLYELITGRRPFDRGDAGTSLGQVGGGRGMTGSLGALRKPETSWFSRLLSSVSLGQKRERQHLTTPSLGQSAGSGGWKWLSEDDLAFYRMCHTKRTPEPVRRLASSVPPETQRPLSEVAGEERRR